jgi:membrane protein YqaA with SNARE-associated domain
VENLSSYGVLFGSAFGAASLLPFYSEPVLVGLVLVERYHVFSLWLVATVGNTAGAVLNWWLAGYALHWQHRSWFPIKPSQLERASNWFNRYGTWSLLMAWLPIGGDGLTFAAGLLRVPLLPFIVLVGIGKGGRYAFVIWVAKVAAEKMNG